MTKGIKYSLANSLKAPVFSFLLLTFIGSVVFHLTNEYIQLNFLFLGINIILALSLNLISGFTGQFSLGHAGFMAVGGYSAAWLAIQAFQSTSIAPLIAPLPKLLVFPVFVLLGGIVAAMAGFLVGLPSLRLRGDYLAIVTLGFSEIIRTMLLTMDSVGGAMGLLEIPSFQDERWLSFTVSGSLINYIFIILWLVICFIFISRVIRSTHGRCMISVREDELAAEAMGVNTTQVKIRAFALSSFFAGVAGALFAFTNHMLSPSTFGFSKTVEVVIMLVLGGMGSLSGSVIAAIVVTLLPEFVLRPLQDFTGIDLRMVIFSLALIIFMVVRPKGFMGRKEIVWPALTYWKRGM